MRVRRSESSRGRVGSVPIGSLEGGCTALHAGGDADGAARRRLSRPVPTPQPARCPSRAARTNNRERGNNDE